MSSRTALLLALAALALWCVLAFVVRVPAGAVHLLLGTAVALAVRWWALRPERTQGLTGRQAGAVPTRP
jgi:hypothetical protein